MVEVEGQARDSGSERASDKNRSAGAADTPPFMFLFHSCVAHI